MLDLGANGAEEKEKEIKERSLIFNVIVLILKQILKKENQQNLQNQREL